jgi:uncharacterized protein YebE (UPF0316 family)
MSERTLKIAWRPRRRPLFNVCLLAHFFCKAINAAEPTPPADLLDNWEIRKPLPPGVALNAIGFGKGLWVGVGYSGTIATSPDGHNWTAQKSSTDADLSGVSYGHGRWVAVGAEGLVFSLETGWQITSGAGVVLTSTNATHWTARNPGKANPLTGISYGNGLWAAVGQGTLATSTDGINWSAPPSGTGNYACIGFGNAHWVESRWGVGIWDRFWRYTRFSLGDLTVRQGSAPFGQLLHYAVGLAYGQGVWVAVGESGSISTARDGFWTERTSGTTSMLMEVAYGDGLWVAVGDDGAILTSAKMDRRPALSITLSGKNAILSWPLDAEGFALESATDLAASPIWSPVIAMPMIANSNNRVTAPLSDFPRFYRLRKQ